MAHNPWNLKHMLAKRLLHEMILKAQASHPGGGVVLVVDPHTSAILSSCLRLSDLLAHGVLVLQKLELSRERLDLPAVYFIEPTEEAFELLIEDFPAPPPPPPVPPPPGAVQAALQSLSLGSGAAGSAAKASPRPSVSGSAPGQSAAAAAAAAAARAAQCQYSCAHLFFTGPVPASLMKRLQSAPMDRRRLRSFVELGIDFCAFESRVFLFDDPHAIPRLYPLPADDESPFLAPPNAALRPAVAQLVSLCATVLAPGERPFVRHVSEDIGVGQTALSKQFADLFDRAMDKRLAAEAAAAATAGAAAAAASSAGAVATAASPSPIAPAPRNSTVLIVDRSLDPLTPLMHEFTFQAMLNDLLRVRGEIAHLRPPPAPGAAAAGPITAPNGAAAAPPGAAVAANGSAPPPKEPATVSVAATEEADLGELVLSEDDPLWIEYRHKHIGEVMVSVNRRLKEFASSNKMAQYQHLQTQMAASKEKAKKSGKDKSAKGGESADDNKDTVKDVLRAVAEMPEYKRRMRQYSKHLALAEACLSKFQQRHLSDLAELEQSLATNADADGAVYSSARQLKEALKGVVLDRAFPEPPLVGVLDKLRLAAVYAVVQGGLPEPLAKVLAAGLHPKLLRSVLGPSARLAAMGVDLESLEPQLSRERVAELIERNQAQTMALMRFVPTLRGILEALVAGQLTEEQFPYTARGGAPPRPPPTPAHSAASTPSSSSARRINKAAAAQQSAAQAGLSEGERARQKLLADAEADVAHRATGRSARRRHSVRDPPPPSLTAAAAADSADEAAASAAAAAAASSAPPAHRFIVFMLGGLSFSEMRCAYEVAEGGGGSGGGGSGGSSSGSGPSVPLLIGSTAALTPAEYLLDLSGLTRKDFHALVLASSAAATAALSTPMATSVAAAEEAAKAKAKAAAAAAAAQLNGKGKQPNGRRGDTDSDNDDDESSDGEGDANGSGSRRRNGRQSGSGSGDSGGSGSSSDSLSDISDPESSDDDEPQRPHPSKRGGSGAGIGGGGGSAAPARSGRGPAAPAVSPKGKSKAKKIVLIFASESDGDEEPPPPPISVAHRSRAAAPTSTAAPASSAAPAARSVSAKSAKAVGSVSSAVPPPDAQSPKSARSDVAKKEAGKSALPLAQRLLRRLRNDD